jgi:hypothetical protein
MLYVLEVGVVEAVAVPQQELYLEWVAAEVEAVQYHQDCILRLIYQQLKLLLSHQAEQEVMVVLRQSV